MDSTSHFDTHAYVKRLVATGVPEPQAEVHAEALGDFIFAGLVTKSDLRAELRALELRLTLGFGGMLAAAVVVMATLVKLL